MRSMTLSQVAYLLKCPSSYSALPIQGYCVDSRLLKQGELFFALKGNQTDGHAYLKDVKNKGAIAAVVSKTYQGDAEGLPLLFVDDSLLALQHLSHTILAQSVVRLVAITGSIGKTSTKEFTKTLLSIKYKVASSPGNSNSQIGIPLTILNHSTGREEIVVLEMGMTNPGNLSRLVQIAPPEVAVITNVALVHACNFESLEDIAWAKAEILSHSKTQLGILCRDVPLFDKISRIGTCPKLSFSTTSSLSDYGLDQNDANVLHARLENLIIGINPLPIPGKHNLHNLLAAIAITRYFGLSWEEIKYGMSLLTLPEKRLQFVRQNKMLFLNDSYNASELSVKAALETIPQPEGKGRKIAVLGSMMELGKFSQDCHRRVGEHALNYVEQIFCLGEECLPICDVWQRAGRPVELFKNRQELVESLKNSLRESDVVLLKGSYSKELWKVLDEL